MLHQFYNSLGSWTAAGGAHHLAEAVANLCTHIPAVFPEPNVAMIGWAGRCDEDQQDRAEFLVHATAPPDGLHRASPPSPLCGRRGRSPGLPLASSAPYLAA